MVNVKLYADGELLDYFNSDDFNIVLKLIADDFSNPSKRYYPYSYTFNLPKTLNNNRIFNNVNSRFVINKFNIIKYNAVLSIDSLTILQGFLFIKEITEDDYKCELQSSYLEFSDSIGKKKLKDLQSFTKVGFNYEETIAAHINAGYSNDSLTNLIPPLSQFSNTGGSSAFWTGTGPRTIVTTAGDRSLIARWAARANTTYTIRITFSGTVGTQALLEFSLGNGFQGAGLGQISRNTFNRFKPTPSPQTVDFKVTPTVNCEMILIRPILYNSGNTFTVSEITLIDPIDTCDWQYPFIMYERYYTPKEIIDLIVAQNAFSGYPSQGSTVNIIEKEATKRNFIITGLRNNTTNSDIRNDANYWQFPPAVYLTKILKYIFQETGFELAGSWIQKDDVKKLIIPYTGDNGVWQNGNGIISKFDLQQAIDDEVFIDKTANQTIFAFGNDTTPDWKVISFNNEISDVNANYSDTTNQYVFPKNYRGKIVLSLNVHVNTFFPSTNSVNATFQIVRNRGGVLDIVDETKQGRTSDNYNLNIESISYDFLQGDIVYVRAKIWSTFSANTITSTGSPGTGEGYVVIKGGTNVPFNSDFSVRLTGGSEETTFLNVAAFLPDMEQLEFLKEVVNLFNLQMIIVDKTIYLEEYNASYSAPSIDLTGKALDDNFTESKIDESLTTLQFRLDDNESDDVPFVPNNLIFPQDLSKIIRIRKKELNVNGKIYKGNEIFNRQEGKKVLQSKFCATNYRRVSLHQALNFTDTNQMFPGLSFYNLNLPIISSLEDLHKDWYTNSGDNVDDKKFDDMSYGNGLRILKYEGNSAQSTHPNKERWWIYLGSIRTRIGLTSFLNLNAKITDVLGYSYFDHKNEIGFSYPNIYTTNDINNKTTDFNFNNDGSTRYNVAIKNAYEKYYEKKYYDLDKSNYLNRSFHLTQLEWNLLNKNRSVAFEGQTYSVVTCDYQIIDGIAKLKLLKRIS